MVNNKEFSITQYSRIKVNWDDIPSNYSKEAKNKIRNYFAKKYNVNKANIDVIYRPIKISENGDVIEINGATIENIMDVSYQRSLMTEWLKRENLTIDTDRLFKLDDKINAELNVDVNKPAHNSWSIKWLSIDNFLSFGSDNYVPFAKLKGLTVVNSIPSNTGGKTTLTIDALKFLLHGSTTKTDKNEEIFNQFSDKNELCVRGMVEIAGEETIIERKLKRTPKKGGDWTINSKLNYYKLLPDGEEQLQNEEDAVRTTTKIKNTIGSEKDFEMLVLATERNLDDLIGLTTTESSKILTRLIGLEIIEMKEAVVRKMFNEFDKKKLSNDYDTITLNDEIEQHKEKIDTDNDLLNSLIDKLTETKNDIISLNEDNDRLLNKKITIDDTIITLNPSKLEGEIETIKSNGVSLKNKITELNTKILAITDITFDEDLHFELTKKYNKNISDKQYKQAEIRRLKQSIETLVSNGICETCNRKLDDVDNTEHITKHTVSISVIESEILNLNNEFEVLKNSLDELNQTKKLIDEKNKLELDKDRLEVEVGFLRNKISSKMTDLKKYTLNKDAIEFNKNIDSEVLLVKTKLSVNNHRKDELTSKIERLKLDISTANDDIIKKLSLIEKITKERQVEIIYKTYIELIGKKGISKLVLRSILPIINSEVQRLLEDTCDFEVEIFINSKNDVQFLINKDNVSKLLKSGSGFEKTTASLALRGVLGKISTLPMPNFITFDEVLGKVANENIEKLKPLFDKIKDMYDIVFLITHNDIIKDWSDKIITVVKENNLSKITLS